MLDYVIHKAINRRALRALESMARSYEPALRDAFLAAIRSARRQTTLDVLEQAMRSYDPAMAIREATGGLEYNQMRTTLADIVQASGAKATTALIPYTGTMIASFNITNPYAAQYARTQVGKMIQQISRSTMEGIQNVIENAVIEGVPPRLAAMQIRGMIGLTEQQTQWALNYESELISQGAVGIDDKVQNYADRLLRQRALTISRSETLRAVNGGQQAAWKAAIDQGLLDPDVEQIWISTKDAKRCSRCLSLDGETAPVIGGVFIDNEGYRVNGPPLHPICRCSLALNL